MHKNLNYCAKLLQLLIRIYDILIHTQFRFWIRNIRYGIVVGNIH